MATLSGIMGKSIQRIRRRELERCSLVMSYMKANSRTIRLMAGAARFMMGTAILKGSLRMGFCMDMESTSMEKEGSMKVLGSKASLKAKMKQFRLIQIMKLKLAGRRGRKSKLWESNLYIQTKLVKMPL